MIEKKLFVFDIDGTLLDSNKKLSEKTITSIQKLQASGHHVCIATGRNYLLAKPIIEALGLKDYILCNGAAGYLNHQLVYQHLLAATELKRFAQRCDEQGVGLIFEDMTLFRAHNLVHLENMQQALTSIQSDLPPEDANFSETHDIYQALAFYPTTAEKVMQADFDQFDFVRWHPLATDVIPKGGSKAVTILELAARLMIPIADVIAFGDGNNDLEMLKTVGLGIAMGNASAEVKRQANQITKSSDEDGIYAALKKMNYV